MDENPCKKDCPERSATCHATCGRYEKYAQKKAAEREARWKESRKTSDFVEHHRQLAARVRSDKPRRKGR